MSKMIIEHDLRGNFGLARDQGLRPTCLAFAISDTHAAVREGWQPLSCEYLYYHAINRNGTNPTMGAAVGPTLEAIEHDGQPAESDWPYLSTLPLDTSAWNPPPDIGDIFRRTGRTHVAGFDVVWSLLKNSQPAIIGMTLSDAFYTPQDGMIDASEPTDPSRRHAVVAVAAGRLSHSRMLMIRNSWGEAWGDEGHAWIFESYLTPRILTVLSLAEAAQ